MCAPPPPLFPPRPQRGGDVCEAFQLLSPEKKPPSDAGADADEDGASDGGGENASPAAAAAAPAAEAKAPEAEGAAAAAGKRLGRKSRIPAYNEGGRAGLVDMTNRE
jgi:hypothetical protein